MPRQSGQVLAVVPSRAPLPAQVVHGHGRLEAHLAAGTEDGLSEPDLQHDLGVGTLAAAAALAARTEALVEEGVEQVPEPAGETERVAAAGAGASARLRDRTCRSAAGAPGRAASRRRR